ncbi:expressed unknown protein [Seminavis robusta]|uniref:Uncharacterized protein n=1 Tax=Seminavis robusta TaxID=568900 RepID=A0A9N8E6V2_9STRA|nr:expressed unknown protein [Seminavis robusta]|eukprot:Sro612_g175440.1 n/a (502) ;mRNA; r:20334-21839
MKTSNKNISIQVSEKWEKLAASPSILDSDVCQETLSEVDEWLTRSSHWLGFTLRFDGGLLDPMTVKGGLQRTLHHFPALGARVVKTDSDKKNLYQLALLPDDQGVVLEYCKGTTSRPDIHLPNDSDTRKLWKDAGLEAPGPGFSGEATEKDPLLRARLIVFEEKQVSYLCIGINHGICDGSGMCDILQVWSHFCTKPDQPLPELLARRRLMGKRVWEAQKPAQSVSDLYERLPRELGSPHDPFSFWTFLVKLLPKAIWCMARQEEVELRVSAAELAALKEAVSKQLPDGEWVSTFEVLCASLLLTKQITSPTPTTSNDTVQHNLHVACNLRGRSKRFAKDYFGNAAFDFAEPMTIGASPAAWNAREVTVMAQEVHRAMRKGLADAESNACRAKDWFEAARHLGIKNTYDMWSPVVFDVLEGDGTFVNSWDKRWLNCGMGAGAENASCMVAWFGTLQNMVVEVPRHSGTGDSTVYFGLPPTHATKFKAFCRKHQDLPFVVVK